LGKFTESANRAAGIDSFYSSTDNNFFITGVQLEVGSVATPFEHRSFGEELALCQRYFSHSGDTHNRGMVHSCYNTVDAYGNFSYPVPMRTAPTVTMIASGRNFYSNAAGRTVTSFTASNIGTHNFLHYLNGSGFTAGHAGHVEVDPGTHFYEADAEL
jgi:hypothetical protein